MIGIKYERKEYKIGQKNDIRVDKYEFYREFFVSLQKLKELNEKRFLMLPKVSGKAAQNWY